MFLKQWRENLQPLKVPESETFKENYDFNMLITKYNHSTLYINLFLAFDFNIITNVFI